MNLLINGAAIHFFPFLLFLIRLSLASYPEPNSLKEAETYYLKGNFAKVTSILKSISSPQPAAFYRLSGHLCLFGQNKDRLVDLPCAWQNYVTGTKLGDTEAMFYTSFMIDHLLFDSLDPLANLFPESHLDLEKLVAISKTLLYLSSVGGFPLSIIKLGYTQNANKDKCELSWDYYSKAASQLLQSFNDSYVPAYLQDTLILSSMDPYGAKNFYAEFESAIHFYDVVTRTLKSGKIKVSWLVWVAFGYMHREEYENAREVIDEVLKLDPGNKDAMHLYGILHYLGETVEKNDTAAFEYFMDAAEKGDADSLNAVGYMLIHGVGVDQDKTLGKGYLKRALKLENVDAAYNLASLYLNSSNSHFIEAAEVLNKLPWSYNSHVNYNFGVMHRFGLGTIMSCPDALIYMKSSAERMVWHKYFANAYELYMTKQTKVAALMYLVLSYIGERTAQVNAGNILETNRVFTEKLWIHSTKTTCDLNIELAYKYYKLVRMQDVEMVNLQLGLNYYYGYTDPVDKQVAFSYFEKAMEGALTETYAGYALFHYGNVLQLGMGGEVNLTRAKEAYLKSLQYDPGLYYPITIMEWFMDLSECNLESLHGLIGIKAGMFVAMWSVVALWLIHIRRW